MRLPRFTARLLMVAIAILAVVLWTAQTGWRSQEYRRRATHHAQVMADRIAGIAACEPNIAGARREIQEIQETRWATLDGRLRVFDGTPQEAVKRYDGYIAGHEEYIAQMEAAGKNTRADAAYHARLWVKYQDAASRPWLPVAPDSPVPQTIADLEAYLTPADEALIARLKPKLPPPSQQRLEAL